MMKFKIALGVCILTLLILYGYTLVELNYTRDKLDNTENKLKHFKKSVCSQNVIILDPDKHYVFESPDGTDTKGAKGSDPLAYHLLEEGWTTNTFTDCFLL